jgi:hypothetical protein
MKHCQWKEWSVLSNKKLSLLLDKAYTLEEIYTLNKTVLNKMCWLFDVSGWVGNVPNLLREAIFHIPRFAGVYQPLREEQKSIMIFLCGSDGRPVAMNQVYEHFLSSLSVKCIDAAITDLLQQGWLLEGEKPHALLAIPDFKKTLDKMSAFYYFLEAKLPATHPTASSGGQCLTDLIEMAAFMYVETPKLTVKKFMAKSVLRRLMLRLSFVASYQWEEAADENIYTNTMRMLLGILHEMGALRLIVDKGDHSYYQLYTEKWDDFIFSPPSHRLLYMLSWQITRIQYHKGGSLPFIASLLQYAAQLKGTWLTGASLMMNSIVAESSVLFSDKDPFSSEEWLEAIVLEPFMYLGLFEKTTAELPTQWLTEGQMPRNFWRLTPLGLALAEWLAERKDANKAISQMVKIDMYHKDMEGLFSPLFSKWRQVLPIELEQQLIIQPDLSFFVPKSVTPYLLWMLSVFAETQIQDYVYQGMFSRNSILRALKGGASVDDLFAMIEDHSKVPPAENVLLTLKQWANAYDKTLFSRVMVLACDTPEMATELLAQSKLSNWIIGLIGPQTLLIQPEGEGTIRKWLEKKNWVPRPKVTSGEGLYTWLTAGKNEK